MNQIKLKKARTLKGEITPPPDKSITHRAIMFASIAEGKSIIRNPLMAEDPISTMNAMRALGVEIDEEASGFRLKAEDRLQASGFRPQKETSALSCSTSLIIHGKGLHGLREPFDVINCGNSGTTARLISGILAGNPFFTVLTGDDSLRQRPMARVINPLKEMGAKIFARQNHRYLPMAIKGGGLKGITYNMPVASAQVKSCLILAGLYAEGVTVIHEPQKSRDHTERLLKSMGALIEVGDLEIKVKGHQPSASGGEVTVSLQPVEITIPSDFSSAAFFVAGALIVPGSEIIIRNVCVNPTRTGLLHVIKEMGGNVRLENLHDVSGEPVADIYCKTASSLRAVKVGKDLIPSLIDEFPVLCVLATQAEGVTEIRGAEELRVKETDRIKAMATELKKMGVELEEYPDGIAIKGKADLKGTMVESYNDHRVAMSLAIAGLIAEGETVINNPECVDISFPGFFNILESMLE